MANEREQANIAKVSGGHLFVEIVCPKCGGTDSRKTDYRIIAISGIYCPAGCGEMFDVEVENPFADAHATAAAEGIPQADGWLCELNEMYDFSKDSAELAKRFKAWLDPKLKEFDQHQSSEGDSK